MPTWLSDEMGPIIEGMKNLSLAALLGFLTAANVLAADDKPSFKLEPVIGYERVQSEVGGRSVRNRLVYGARGTFGYRIISGELEYLRGQDTQVLTSGTSILERTERARIGARSGYTMGEMLVLSARAGLEARSLFRETTPSSGSKTTVREPLAYAPYAGTDLSFKLAEAMQLSLGAVVVFKDFPDMSKNDYQTTFSLGIKYP